MPKKQNVTILTRLQEHPNTFRVDSNVLICEYCNEPVEWKSKSTVDNHCNSKKHKTNKNNFESQEHAKKQASIQASF
ncbi:9253_t:CDS:1, partial [Dentiscutata heterogama]